MSRALALGLLGLLALSLLVAPAASAGAQKACEGLHGAPDPRWAGVLVSTNESETGCPDGVIVCTGCDGTGWEHLATVGPVAVWHDHIIIGIAVLVDLDGVISLAPPVPA